MLSIKIRFYIPLLVKSGELHTLLGHVKLAYLANYRQYSGCNGLVAGAVWVSMSQNLLNYYNQNRDLCRGST